jgi:hypothetical protein
MCIERGIVKEPAAEWTSWQQALLNKSFV